MLGCVVLLLRVVIPYFSSVYCAFPYYLKTQASLKTTGDQSDDDEEDEVSLVVMLGSEWFSASFDSYLIT